MSKTSIEWTQYSWNPIGGCRRKSPGCQNCYAERQAYRLAHNPNEKIAGFYRGLTQITNGRPGWTGEVSLNEDVLLQPLKRKTPTTYFISLSDLFYDGRPNEHIDRVFAVMALTPQHTYQILTKYPERMHRYLTLDLMSCRIAELAMLYRFTRDFNSDYEFDAREAELDEWPLPNVHLGVSVENQQYADERIPLLLRTPASLRFVSYEPALGPVDFSYFFGRVAYCGYQRADWVIVGGESGPGARPFDVEWARSTVRQCRDAGVPCFVKQLGSRPIDSRLIDIMGPDNTVHYRRPPGDMLIQEANNAVGYWTRESVLKLRDKKGGRMEEWPDGMRVRQLPEVARA